MSVSYIKDNGRAQVENPLLQIYGAYILHNMRDPECFVRGLSLSWSRRVILLGTRAGAGAGMRPLVRSRLGSGAELR